MEALNPLYEISTGLRRALLKAQPMPPVPVVKALGGKISLSPRCPEVSQTGTSVANRQVILSLAGIAVVTLIAFVVYKEQVASKVAEENTNDNTSPVPANQNGKKEPFMMG